MRKRVDKEAIYAAGSDPREDYALSLITSLRCNYWEKGKSAYSCSRPYRSAPNLITFTRDPG